MNATLVGFFAVLVWGLSLPMIRLLEGQIGILAYIGAMYISSGTLGVLLYTVKRQKLINRKFFSNPAFYGRWLFFVVNSAAIIIAISTVSKENAPFVILLNYLWPTAVILCSMALADVRISRWWAFLSGSIIVVASLSIEIFGSWKIPEHLFADASDCWAYILAFMAAISWGLYSALSRRAGAATGGSSVLSLFQLTLSLALPLSFLPGFATWDHLTGWWPALLVGNSILLFLSFMCWDYGIRLGNIVILSLAADFIPWISLFTYSSFFHVHIEDKTIFAAVLLVAGAMITRYGTLPKRGLFAPPKAQLNLEREPP